MEDKKYCIYKHTNLINQKVYIGQTCQKPQYRWGKNGSGYKQCPYFYNAIQKYGWNNFSHQILEQDLTAIQADEKQRYYIQLFKSTQVEYGYNSQLGGSNHALMNQEAKEKHRQKIIERWQNKDFKQSISQKMKEKWKDEQYRKKRTQPLSKQHIENIKESSQNISHWNDRAVVCIETNQIYKSSGEASRILNINANNIRSACAGNRRTAGNYHWIFLDEDSPEARKKKMSKPIGNGLKIICIQTNQIFNSTKEAAKWCGLSGGSGISAVCNGKRKTAGKHPVTGQPLTWKKLEE